MIVIRNRDVIDFIPLDLVLVSLFRQSLHYNTSFMLRFLTVLGIQSLNLLLLKKINCVEDVIRYLNCTSSQEI